jgi:hypothetical protein
MDRFRSGFSLYYLWLIAGFLLSGSLSMYAENCDKSVLKRLLKQLWRIVMKSLERNVVLPPMSEKVINDNIFILFVNNLSQNVTPI